MLDLKDEFASLMDWTHQTAEGQCYCSALVDVPIVRGVFMCFPPQEHSGVPDGIVNPLVGMFEVINRTAHLAAVATATGTGTLIRGCIKKFLDFLPQTASRWH
jgi:hypothetical protein